MLIPKKLKHKKHHRGHTKGKALSGNVLSFGAFGLRALENSWVTSRQIESARRAMTRSVARGGKIWIRIFPDKPISKKPPETRMGSGKGDVYEYVAVVRPGRMLFEMAGISEEDAKESMRLASRKLPVRTKFIVKE